MIRLPFHQRYADYSTGYALRKAADNSYGSEASRSKQRMQAYLSKGAEFAFYSALDDRLPGMWSPPSTAIGRDGYSDIRLIGGSKTLGNYEVKCCWEKRIHPETGELSYSWNVQYGGERSQSKWDNPNSRDRLALIVADTDPVSHYGIFYLFAVLSIAEARALFKAPVVIKYQSSKRSIYASDIPNQDK